MVYDWKPFGTGNTQKLSINVAFAIPDFTQDDHMLKLQSKFLEFAQSLDAKVGSLVLEYLVTDTPEIKKALYFEYR